MKRLKTVHPNTSTLDPRGATENFEFAFDDSDLSVRVLHIEIVEDSLDSKFDNEGDVTGSHGLDCSVVVKVTDIHISSPIVAAKSPFFYKLFKNGMIESLQKDLTLRVTSSEEASLVDILKFTYKNTLSATTVADLLAVLVVAEKYEVVSCMRYCVEVLQEMPMSLESALLYLELPSCVRDSEVVQPLMLATKQYLAARYRNIDKSREEVMSLPLAAVEVVLGSDGLEVFSEDAIFDLVLNWARKHYPELEERRDILSHRLSRLIRFRKMTSEKLKQVLLNCPDFDYKQVSKLVFDALLEAEGRAIYAATDPLIANSERVYSCHPIKVVSLEFSTPSWVVYFELKKQDCADLFQSRYLVSDRFCLHGQWFSLQPRCWKDPQSSLDHFGLSVVVYEGSQSFTFDLEIEVMQKTLRAFESKHKCSRPLIVPDAVKVVCLGNVFGIEWKDFMADESEYFTDDILHLRVNMTIKPLHRNRD